MQLTSEVLLKVIQCGRKMIILQEQREVFAPHRKTQDIEESSDTSKITLVEVSAQERIGRIQFNPNRYRLSVTNRVPCKRFELVRRPVAEI
jgi:hypothetical protein